MSNPTETVKLITRAQSAYIRTLIAECGDAADEVRETLNRIRQSGHVTREQASWAIGTLRAVTVRRVNNLPSHLSQSRTEPVKPSIERYSPIPDGRYALRDGDDVVFYSVRRGEDEWAGKIFVDRFVSDDTFPIKGKGKFAILDKILLDPKGAAVLFGQESSHCCVCGRRLTTQESRSLGIGPRCILKFG